MSTNFRRSFFNIHHWKNFDNHFSIVVVNKFQWYFFSDSRQSTFDNVLVDCFSAIVDDHFFPIATGQRTLFGIIVDQLSITIFLWQLSNNFLQHLLPTLGQLFLASSSINFERPHFNNWHRTTFNDPFQDLVIGQPSTIVSQQSSLVNSDYNLWRLFFFDPTTSTFIWPFS